MTVVRARRWLREPFSGMSHLGAALLSVAGLVALLLKPGGSALEAVAFSIYGASLIILYLCSALYHLLHAAPQVLQRLDHSAIYLLIAGTYVPVCLLGLGGGWGWALFGVEYGLALVGIAAAAFWRTQPDWFRVALYIIMGWLALIAIAPLSRSLPPEAVRGLVVGGLLYTAGAVVFACDRPHLWPGRFSAHDLWHVFVIAGSAAHYVVVFRYLG